MDFDWKKLVGSVAPAIATALGGPMAGLGVKAITEALGLKAGASEKDVAAALAGATPDQLLALKQADHAFALKMEELGVNLEEINARDRDSARRREIDTGDSWTPRLLAMGVTAGFFGVLAYMLKYGLPAEAGGRDAMLLMLGSLGTAWTGIVAYYFGSSAGSKAKTDAMARAK